jgi:hypothetical protein
LQILMPQEAKLLVLSALVNFLDDACVLTARGL